MKQVWCGVLYQPLLQQLIPNRARTKRCDACKRNRSESKLVFLNRELRKKKVGRADTEIRQRNKSRSMSRDDFGLEDAEDGTIEAITSDREKKKLRNGAARVVFLTVLAAPFRFLFFLGVLGCFC